MGKEQPTEWPGETVGSPYPEGVAPPKWGGGGEGGAGLEAAGMGSLGFKATSMPNHVRQVPSPRWASLFSLKQSEGGNLM